MKTIEIKLYQFSELTKDIQEKVMLKWYENEEYPFLDDNLTEDVKQMLFDNGCEYKDIELYYSLSYSQGDGLCFIGTISKNGKELVLTHKRSRYYYATSVEMSYYDAEGEEIDEVKELKDIYLEVCKEAEKSGYAELAYRMTTDEFSEMSDENEYTYESDGTIRNE